MPEPPLHATVLNPRRRLSFISNPWFYPLLACFLLLILLSVRKVGTYDLGFHLKSGQWILQHHSFPRKDTYTYTQTDRDYLDSNGLYQVLLFLFYQAFDYSSLTFFNAGMILLVFAFLWVRLNENQAPPFLNCLLFLTAILVMERRFIVRPEIFSWFYLNLTLWILESRFRRTRNLLYLLPLVQLLWVNTEGLFMLGWAAMGIYGLSGWVHEKRPDSRLMGYSLLSVAVCFLNPYGLKGLLFPFLLWTRLQSSNIYNQTISEFFSPWRFLTFETLKFDLHLHLFLFLALALMGLWLFFTTARERKFHELFLFLIFLFLACKAVRNIPLFILVAAPILSACLAGRASNPRWAFLSNPKIAMGLALLTALWGLRVATDAYYLSDRRGDRIGWGVDAQRLPVGAAQFLVQNNLNGRMVNDLNFGGWLDWQAPQPTFIDGRLEVPSDSFYRQVRKSFELGGLIPLLTASQAQLVVMEYNSAAPWADLLHRFSSWRLIYLDECAAIYARQDYAPQIQTLSFPDLLKSKNIPSETESSSDSQLWNLRPSKFKSWLRGFYQPQTYAMGTFSMGQFAVRAREYGPARDILMEGFRRTNGAYEEVFFNLADVNLRLKNYELGRLCLEYTLALDPQNQSASETLKNLGH